MLLPLLWQTPATAVIFTGTVVRGESGGGAGWAHERVALSEVDAAWEGGVRTWADSGRWRVMWRGFTVGAAEAKGRVAAFSIELM
jgi:hypothetical protein